MFKKQEQAVPTLQELTVRIYVLRTESSTWDSDPQERTLPNLTLCLHSVSSSSPPADFIDIILKWGSTITLQAWEGQSWG